jgi:PAS domain S-box-containing protein
MLAELVEQQREALTERWLAAVRPLAPHPGLAREALVGSLPDLLTELVRALRHLADASLPSPLPDCSPAGEAHGAQRQSLGYATGAVAREYALLQEAVLQLATATGVPVPAAEGILLARCMGTATAEALSHFLPAPERAARREAVPDRNAHALAEERYRALFQSLDDGFCVIQLLDGLDGRPVDYRFLEVNPAFAAQTGLQGAVGRTARELVPSLDVAWFERYGAVAATGEAARFESEAPAMGRWFEVYATRVGAPEERQVALVFKDVTARKAAEKERAEALVREQAERGRLTTILSTLEEGVMLQDARGVLRFSNAAAERMFGMSAEQMDGRTSATPEWEPVWADGRPAPAEEHPPMEALRTGRAVTGCIIGVRDAEGRRVWLSINAQPLFEPDGRTPAGVVSSFFDITAQRAAEAERERLTREVEAQRQRLASLIQHAPASICTLRGPDHVFELVNPPYERLVGVGRRSVGLPVREALPEVVEQGFTRLLDGVFSTGEPFIGSEVPLRVDRRGDGTLEDAWVNFVYQPARDATGAVVGIDVFGFDVTEQVRARKQVEALAARLQESEERLRRVVEASGAGTWELDVASGAIAGDARFTTLMGLPADAPLTLSSALEATHPEDRERVSQAIAAAITGEAGGRYAGESRTVGLGNAPVRWVEARGQVVFDAEGRAVRFSGTTVDVTARKAAEAQAQARADFEQKLIGIVGHDLRQPLQTISMSAQVLLSRGGLEERARRAAERIRTSTERAGRMLRDILDFTQARLGGGIPLSRGDADVALLLREVAEDALAAHPDRQVLVEVQGDGQGVWDADRLHQVLDNLLTNALTYGAPQTPVRLSLDGRTEAAVVVRVHNEGPPIPPESLPRLFAPMQRGDAPAGARRSVGLGLFIVEHLVQAHGGRIEVESTAAAGTTFTLLLPRRPLEAPGRGAPAGRAGGAP